MKNSSFSDSTPKEDSIAVVGLGCLFPGSHDRHGFWAGMRAGSDHVGQVPDGYWTPDDYHDPDKNSPDRTYGNRGAFLSPIPFHPLEYGITPRDLEATDTSQLLGLVAAKQALQDAGYDAQKTFDREKASVILGVTGALELVIPLGARLGHPLWWKALRESGVDDAVASEVVRKISEGYVDWQENSFPGLLGNVVAGRIANRLDLHGTNCVTDAACASSLAALHLASLELKNGRSDLVVTGGVDTFNDIFMYMCFSKTPALSPTGDARPFDAEGDGTVLGEGIGVVVLKRWEDAVRDGDRIYSKILSVGTSSDGKGAAIYAPTSPGQQRALRDGYELAGVSPETIQMVEAHGTGTAVGDATELKALDELYRQSGSRPGSVALGSVKSQIGHTKAAAGAAGLIKAVLALHHKVQPPSLKIRRPLEILADSQSPFHVEETARPWVAKPGHPRRAAVSSFGFGGSNFHAVLEENQSSRSEADWLGVSDLIAFSADDASQLMHSIRDFQNRWHEAESEESHHALARETRRSFQSASQHRLVITLHENSNATELLSQALQQLEREAEPRWHLPVGIDRDHGAPRGPLAVIFPGQGSQRVDMGRHEACRFPEMIHTVDKAEASFWNSHEDSGLSSRIWPVRSWSAALTQQESRLRQTEVAQPAIGAISLGLYRVLETLGVRGELFAGHSYGELTALAASGRIVDTDFHQLSNFRGQLMAEAGGMDAGTMLAVHLPLEELERLVSENWPDLVVANRNAPEQAVLSGGSDSIEAARVLLEKRGVRCTPLPVAAAFHSTRVSSAAQPFGEILQKVRFNSSTSPVFANSSATPYPADETGCRSLLANQIARPVLFKEMIEAMLAQGTDTFIEVGPGKVLSGLVKAIATDRNPQVRVQSTCGTESDCRTLARAVALIAVRGYAVQLGNWKPLQQKVTVEGKGPVVWLRGANLRPGEGLANSQPRPVPAAPAHLPAPTMTSPQMDSSVTTSPSPAMALQQTSPAREDSRLMDQQEALMDAIEKALEIRDVLDRQQQAAEDALARSLQGETPVATFDPPVAEVVEASSPPQNPAPPATVPTPEPAPPVSNSMERDSLVSFMAEVVAEKTGYPVNAIEPAMDLEADLGIDSIKRVEILSSMRQQRPSLPTLAPEVLGSLRTIDALVDHFLKTGEGNDPGLTHPQADRAPEPEPVTSHTPSQQPSGSQKDFELESLLIEVVAEKTGYPQSAIDVNLDLEADLGIDSIKRVEILSALRQHRPDLEALPAETLGSLRTISSIVDHYSGNSGAQTVPRENAAPAVTTPAVSDSSPAQPSGDDSLGALLIEVIAEKTGYPADAIGTDLDLEADLGIDSIKRVEILSALRQHRPDLQALPAETLGSLRSIAAIVEHYGEASHAPSVVSDAPTPIDSSQPVSTGTTPTNEDRAGLTQLMVDVIAEKTGYPSDSIGTDLDLEADLGIDSIKRVEILSALRQVDPNLPTLPPEQLGSLRTIDQLVKALGGSSPAPRNSVMEDTHPTVSTPFPSTEETHSPVAGESLEALLLDVIAEKTGYPSEAIGTDLDLEADLGIDSIKRVEILSALRQHRPDLTAIPADQLGSLRSISDIAGWYSGGTPENAGHSPLQTESDQPQKLEPVADLPPLNFAVTTTTPLAARDTTTQRILDTELDWWVIGNDPLVREQIVDELTERGVNARPWNLRDSDQVSPHQHEISGFVLVGSAEPQASEPFELFRWLRVAGQCLRHHPKGLSSAHFVTRLGGNWGSENDSQHDPLGGALLGLARCAAREWSDFIVRGIDLDHNGIDQGSVGREIVEEIFHGDETFVGLGRHGRQGWSLNPISPPTEQPVPIESGDLIVVTGGARGVTAECLDALTRVSSPSLYLLGRTPEPGNEPDWAVGVADADLESRLFDLGTGSRTPAEVRKEANMIRQSREIQARIREWQSRGCQVTYRSVDGRQLPALSAILDEARTRHGEVRGIIHGAGVLADGWIVEKSDADFLKVWETKVETARNLLHLCENDRLKLVQFFSSTTATLGRKGQSDYAAANETLNQIALQTAVDRPTCHVGSIGWGPWDGGMVESGLRDLFHSEGVGLIPLKSGAEHFAGQVGSVKQVHHLALCQHGERPEFLEEIATFSGPQPERQVTPFKSSAGSSAETDQPVEEVSEMPSASPATSAPKTESLWEEQLQLEISCVSDPALRDHVLQGRAVIPAALLLEWCAQIASHRNPGLEFVGVDNFRVLKGVVIGAREIAQLSFHCGTPQPREGMLCVPVEIRSGANPQRIHVRTEVLLGDQQPASCLLQAFDAPPTHDYSNALFHGESFRCLVKVLGLNSDGITFTAKGTPPPGNGFRSPLLPFWLVDPLRIDAIFQALIVWSDKIVGAPCLPCAIGQLRVHGNARVGELETRIEIDRFSPSSAKARAEILNETGSPLITLTDAEVVIDSALEVAFQQQELSEEASS